MYPRPIRLNLTSLSLVRQLSSVAVMLLAVLLSGALSSCSTSKNELTYFTDLSANDSGVLPGISVGQPTLQPDDELTISVNSASAAASAPYNLPLYNPMTHGDIISGVSSRSATTTPQPQTYIVDSKGNIKMPVIGELHVAGLTLEQLTELITDKVSTQVKDPVVRVDMVNFRVNVLGEVRSPRAITVSRQNYSVLDALADCGDLTQYGVRDNIVVMRRQPDGSIAYQRLDLRDASITSSPYYYLRQNDVIYVEPNEIKQSNSRYDSMKSYKLTAISTVVSAASVIASLVIALTVK